MPTISEIGLQIPKTYQEFESIVCDVFTSMFGVQFQKVGVNGQAQNGIDLIGDSIGVQCKNYVDSKLTINKLEKDILEAEQIQPPLEKLYIVTTAKRDAVIQNYIRNRGRNFQLYIYYWDVIKRYLLQNPNIAELHYPRNLLFENSTQTFCNEFLKLCNKYYIKEAIFDTDYICPFSEKLFDNIELFCIETESLLYSDRALNVDNKKLQETAEFINGFRSILQFVAIKSYPSGNGHVIPKIPHEERNNAEIFLKDNRNRLAEIYSEFKFGKRE